MTELDATILREFIGKILVSSTSGKKGRRADDKEREFEIFYNFIGVGKAIEQAQTNQNNAKVRMALGYADFRGRFSAVAFCIE